MSITDTINTELQEHVDTLIRLTRMEDPEKTDPYTIAALKLIREQGTTEMLAATASLMATGAMTGFENQGINIMVAFDLSPSDIQDLQTALVYIVEWQAEIEYDESTDEN